MEAKTIAAFWSWFSAASRSLTEDSITDFSSLLDRKIRNLGPYSWEIGPALKKENEWFIAISPGGNRNLLKDTRSIAKQAPDIPKWEVYSSLPQKNWNHTFVVNSNGEEISVDASGWRYAFLKYPDDATGIVLRAPHDPQLSHDALLTAGTILVDSELGEGVRLDNIDELIVEWIVDDDLQTKTSHIATLREAARRLFGHDHPHHS